MIRTDAGPKYRHGAITPSDSAILTIDATIRTGNLYHALFIGTAGTISIEDHAGVIVSYAVPAGYILPFSPLRVRATGTTATGIVGWRDD